jgi:DNA-directed RNA polymerase subunit M/transcription elongation factor TFIIS
MEPYQCPACGHIEAEFEHQDGRSTDAECACGGTFSPPHLHVRCTECGHVQRAEVRPCPSTSS